MSTPIVLDASAAVRAVLDASAQPRLIDRLAEAPLVLAPALLRVECANALWKYVRAGVLDKATAVERHGELTAMVHRFVDEEVLFPEALQFAADADHPVYDAVYALAARRHAATLLTFDKRVRDLCKRARIDCECFTT